MTIKEFLNNSNDNIKQVSLITNGLSVGNFSVEEAKEKYGNWNYISTHSQNDSSAIILMKNF